MVDIGITSCELQKLIGVLSSYPEISKAIVYGSRAKGCNHRFSDIDLTLDGDGLTGKHLKRIMEQVDDLLLPYEVDLSLFGKIKNDALVEHIKRVGKVIYEPLKRKLL